MEGEVAGAVGGLMLSDSPVLGRDVRSKSGMSLINVESDQRLLPFGGAFLVRRVGLPQLAPCIHQRVGLLYYHCPRNGSH